jgi:hypothetical protein
MMEGSGSGILVQNNMACLFSVRIPMRSVAPAVEGTSIFIFGKKL